MRWIGYVAAILWWSGIARSLSSMNRGYKISPKPCRVPGKSASLEGTCMFVWECIKSEGTHVGVCVDTFMFGSCCVHNTTSNSITSLIGGGGGGVGHNTVRPSLADALAETGVITTSTTMANTVTTNTITTTTITSTNYSTRRHQSTSHYAALQANGQGHVSPNTTRHPSRPSSILSAAASRPLQKRPHSKPHNSNPNDPDYHDHPKSNATRTRPQISSYHEKRPEEDRHHGSPLHHHHHHHHHQHHYQGFKDKVSGGSSVHNTLHVRLPSKNQRPYQRPRPYPNDDNDETAKQDGHPQDLSVQESIHRPSINSVDDDEATDKLNNPSLNFIHTERPQWATKPLSSNNRPAAAAAVVDYSKPYFSVKTTSTSSTTVGTTQRPHSSRPETSKPSSVTTAIAVSHYGGQPTSAAGSVPQTAHWQVTTEPAFVTRHKPNQASSSLRPESSWHNKPQLHKPQWTDSQRPSYKPTETQENNVYQKPYSAHYITISYLENPTKSRPTKKPTSPAPPTTSLTSNSIYSSSSSSTTPTSTTTPSTTTTSLTATSTISTSTTTTTSAATQRPITTPASTASESSTEARTGSVLTIPAAAEANGMACGVPALFPRMPETRIVGGKEAAFGKWPWQVSVRRTSFFGFSSTHRCGGAVLNENWIATAGHCVDDLLTSQIRIRVGEYDFSSVQERLPYVERGITKKVVHPKYNFFTFEYDLALVRLETPLNFAAHISPICLPASDELLIGENATVTGWGRLSEGGTLPSILQEVSVPIVSNERCKSMFLRAGRHEFIPEIFLCAGYENGGQDSCQGDSGGPLQVRGKDGRYFLAGIISWGIGCAEANLPGVCTRISKFVPWILKNVT